MNRLDLYVGYLDLYFGHLELYFKYLDLYFECPGDGRSGHRRAGGTEGRADGRPGRESSENGEHQFWEHVPAKNLNIVYMIKS